MRSWPTTSPKTFGGTTRRKRKTRNLNRRRNRKRDRDPCGAQLGGCPELCQGSAHPEVAGAGHSREQATVTQGAQMKLLAAARQRQDRVGSAAERSRLGLVAEGFETLPALDAKIEH